jgi:acyl carrier protein
MRAMHDATSKVEEDLACQVLAVIREEGVVELGPGFGVADDLFVAGLDSMAVMQLLVALEERFGVAFAAEDVSRERFRTAAALAGLLEAKRRS